MSRGIPGAIASVLWVLSAWGACTRHRPAVPPIPPPQPPQILLLGSADVRGQFLPVEKAGVALGGLARRATVVDHARLDAIAVVQVDAGDVLPVLGIAHGGLSEDAFDLRARMLLTANKRMAIDAFTPGERELALGVGRLKLLLASTKTPVVASNLVGDDGAAPFPTERLVDAAGHAVGLLGILELGNDEAARLKKVGVTTKDAIVAARAAVQNLRGRGAQLVVGLFHLAGGRARAEEILKQVAGIDVVLLGHGAPSDVPDRNSSRPGSTVVVYPGSEGTHVARIEVRFRATPSTPELTALTLPLTSEIREQFSVALLERINSGPIRHLAEGPMSRPEKAIPEDWTYSSSGACAFCHTTQTAQWKTTDHASAFGTLKQLGHERDPQCLGCHMTGFVQPGGTRDYKTATTYLSDVGCESCHGPSADHVRNVTKENGKGTSRKVDAMVCLGCHTPDQNIETFDYAASLKQIMGPGHGMPERTDGAAGGPPPG